MKTYANMLTSDLLQGARKKFNSIRKCENHGTLTAKDVYPTAWEARKPNSNTPSMIQSLNRAEGRKLELQWKASTKGTSQLENQRSFRQTVITEFRTAGKVPSLMQLAATEAWCYGQELSIHDIPRECQFFVQNLPNIVQSLNMDLPSTLGMLTTELLLQEEWKSNMGWLFVKRYFRKTIIFNNYCIYKFHTQLNVLQFCSIWDSDKVISFWGVLIICKLHIGAVSSFWWGFWLGNNQAFAPFMASSIV